MGFRGQNNRDDYERRRYRAEVPLRYRLWYKFRASVIVVLLFGAGLWVFVRH